MLGELSAGVDIAAPVERVWAYVTDWERQSEWVPLTTVRVDGDTVVARTAVGPIGFDDTMEVDLWQPPHRCEVVHTGRVVRGSAAIVCTTVGAGTRLTWTERFTIPGGPLAPILWRVAEPVLRQGLAYALRRLRARLESGAADGAAE